MRNKIYIEPPESERRYLRLANLGKELGVPVPQVFLEMKVTMPDGKVVHHHKQRSHSWNRNAYNQLFEQLAAVNGNDNTFAGGKLSAREHPGGTVRYGTEVCELDSRSNMLTAGKGYTGASGSVTNGILVGSGANTESFEDYALQTLITNGAGAGQLSYALSEAYVISYVAGTKTLTATHLRYMNNNSAGDVLVNEVGLVYQGAQYFAPSYPLFLNSRDHLGATVTIPASGQLKVTYTISLVYPS